LPEASAGLGDGDAEVERVGERPVPVDPVVRDDRVVGAQSVGDGTDDDGVGVQVDAAVLEQYVSAPHVAQVRRAHHRLTVHLPSANNTNTHTHTHTNV